MNYWANRIKNNKNLEKSVGSINIIFIEQPSVDFAEALSVIEKKVPNHIVQLIDTIYVGKFPELDFKQVNAAYIDGAIYMLPDFDSVEDVVDDIVHEMGHAFEDKYGNYIYADLEISKEFLSKRETLRDVISSDGIDVENYDFHDVNYSFELDELFYIDIGYPTMETFCSGLFMNPYAATSLREYFATAFEDYFLFRDRNSIKNLCPVVYNKLQDLEANLL